MGPALVTGGAGFFGSLLKQRLIDLGIACVSVDLQPDSSASPLRTAVRGDIRDADLMERLFSRYHFRTVFHCAAILAHAVKDERFLWSSNVEGTRVVADCAARHGTRALVFTSSNCLWARNFGRPVTEDDRPEPVEIYGRSKWEGEKVLAAYAQDMTVVTLRCPTIIDEGRLGLLAILFEFIDEGRKVWVVGGGHNRYQFVYAQDLIDACLRAADAEGSMTCNVGSDDVRSFRDTYGYVIGKAGTGARVASLPRAPALLAMRAAHLLRISPLGPYQYKMIAEDFIFDTGRIKAALGWRPTLNNHEMLWRSYEYYRRHRAEIAARREVSAHRQAAPMGVIRLLKWLS